MKRPLVPVALCYGIGLLLAEFCPLPFSTLICWSLVLLVVTWVWTKYRTVWLGLFVAACGWTNLALHTQIIAPRDLRLVAGSNAHWVTVTGKLSETPTLRVFDAESAETYRTMAQVEVDAVELGGTNQSAKGRVIVNTSGTLPAGFFAGQRVQINGVLAPPRPPVARGLFDYRAHLARQGIYHQLKVEKPEDWGLLSSNRPPFTDRFIAWASRTLACGLPVEDEELRLNWAMVLGWKTALTSEVSTPFMRSGTMHIFAISGLHIALIAGILVAVLRVLRLPRLACGLVVIPLIWFYTAATGWQSSAIRSTVMMTVIIGGWALNRPNDLINSLAVAALAILLWQPQQLFQPSFQLSFFVVLSIALFMPPLEKLRDRLLQTDPLLPRELLPRWRRWLAGPLHWFTTLVATSVAAWLGSLPLTAHYFHLFSPVTLLANVIVVPLSTLALASALGSLMCGAWFPCLTELFNHSAWLWMKWMVNVSEWATTLPAAYAYVPSPPGWVFAAYYAALFGILSGKIFAPGWRKLTAIGCALVAGLGWMEWRQAQTTFQLTVLPLNGGHAVQMDGPGRTHDMLIDCGASNSVRFVTLPFLRAQGVNRLPRLMLTHGDLQAVGGTELLRADLPVAEVDTSAIYFRSGVYRQILAALEKNNDRRRILAAGDDFAGWEVLHPPAGNKIQAADDACIVLLGRFHSTRVLLLADLSRVGQETLLRGTNNLQADIVISGLPEKSDPLSDALLERVQPKLIIIADSEYPAPARASPKIRERLKLSRIPVLYTREVGAVEITVKPVDWQTTKAR